MHHTLEDLAALVGGTLEGDGGTHITGARSITEAGPHDITFAENDRNLRLLKQSQAGAAVVGLDAPVTGLALIRVAQPRRAYGAILSHLQGQRPATNTGVHPSACIAPSARIGRDASIGPYVVVGEEVMIGDRCRLMPGVVIGDRCCLGDDVELRANVVLYAGSVLGHRVIVHAGCVLGADGFGYHQEGGRHVKDFQLGRVEIGDDVEIGANTTIDRATFFTTRVGEGSKIDNLVMVAHNCQIGRHNLLVSQVGIAGSSRTGDHVVIAGQAGIGDHLSIGDGAVIGAMGGVMKDVPPGARMLGIPATPDREQFLLQINLRKLPERLREMRDELARLTQQIQSIEQRVGPQRMSA